MRVRKLKPKVKKDNREKLIVYRHDRKAIRALGGVEAMKAFEVKEFEFMGYWQGRKLWRPDCWLVPAVILAKAGAVPITSEAAYQVREKQKATGRAVYARRLKAKEAVAELWDSINSHFKAMQDEGDTPDAPTPTTEPATIGAELIEDVNVEPFFDVDTCGFLEG